MIEPPLPSASWNATDRRAMWLLVPLLLLLLFATLCAPWHCGGRSDEQAYIEMMDGILRHGLPYSENGQVARFPELQVMWDVWQDGKLWPKYAPAYPYFGAPIYGLWGVQGVIRANFAVMAALALGVFFLGRRVSGQALLGTCAAYVTVLATPLFMKAFMTSPYPLSVTCSTWAVLLIVVALGAEGRRAGLAAAGGGLLMGLAGAVHLASVPMALGLIAVLWPWPRRGAPQPGARPPGTGPALLAFLGFLLPLMPGGVLPMGRARGCVRVGSG